MRWRTRSFILCALYSFGAISQLGCSQPQSSGTKTNWFQRCDEDGQCGEEGVCVCGVCSEGCLSLEDCPSGVCGSEIATAAQCEAESTQPTRICLPESSLAACGELLLPLDGELGSPDACEVPGSLICESFDTPLSAGSSTWAVGDAHGALQECVTHKGSGALVERAEVGALIQTRFRLPAPVQEGTLHVRFFFRIDGEGILPTQTTIFEFWDQEAQPVEQTSLLVRSDGSLEVFVAPGSHSLQAAETDSLPRDTWVCVEISDELGFGDGSLTVRVDGRAVMEASALTTRSDSPLAVAVLQTQPISGAEGNPVEFYFDELVVGTSPIGCE